MIEHNVITDPEIHEPKGISVAADNTLYIADGVGSGAWEKIKSDSLAGLTGDGGVSGLHLHTNGSNGFMLGYSGLHGVMVITNNSVAFPVTAVADTTFNTPSQYSLVSGVGAPWTGELNNGILFSVDRLTVPADGIYKIDLWGTINAFPANNARVSFRYRLNGGAFSTRKPTVKTNSSADPRLISGFGLVPLSANDYLQLYVASDLTGNIVFGDLNTTLTLVRPL